MSYDVIYMLKPAYEDLKRGGTGWYKLKWRPIWRQTFSTYCRGSFTAGKYFGFRYINWDARNGWHRSFKHRLFVFTVFKKSVTFWVRYAFMVHKDGPSDVEKPRPLDLSELR